MILLTMLLCCDPSASILNVPVSTILAGSTMCTAARNSSTRFWQTRHLERETFK